MELGTSCDECGEEALYVISRLPAGANQYLCARCASRRFASSQETLDPVASIIEHLESLPPVLRAKRAKALLDDLQAEVARQRSLAARELRAQGLVWAEVASLLGVSVARAANIASQSDRVYKAQQRRRARLGVRHGRTNHFFEDDFEPEVEPKKRTWDEIDDALDRWDEQERQRAARLAEEEKWLASRKGTANNLDDDDQD